MKCPKCKNELREWRHPCGCGYRLDFSRLPDPPKQAGFVNDYEAIVGDQAGKMIQLALEFEKRTGIELVAVVIGTTKPLLPENYAFFLFNKWRLGKKNGNAVLMLVSMHERRIEIEVGAGLENILGKAFLEKLLDETVMPLLKKSKYGEGLFEGMKLLVNELDSSPVKAQAA